MNNNFKKLLASAMALAMVTTVVPAVGTTEVKAVSYCKDDVTLAYVRVLKVFEDAELDIDTMKLTDKVLEDTKTVKAYLANNDVQNAIIAFNGCNVPADETANKLIGFVDSVEKLESEIAAMEGVLIEKDDEYFTKTVVDEDGDTVQKIAEEDGAWVDAIPSGKISRAKGMYAYLTGEEAEAYLENISAAHIAAYDAYIDVLETRISEYNEDNYGSIVEDYVNALKEVKLYSETTVGNFLDAKGAVEYTNLSAFSKVVETIEDNKVAALKKIANFDDVADEEDIAEIMDALHEAIDGMTEVKELVKTKNVATTAFNKAGGTEVIEILAGKTAKESEFNDELGGFKTDVLEAIADYYNEVVSNFYEITVKQRANGKYTVSNAPTDLVKYLKTTQQASYESVFNGLAKLVDNAEETTYFDLMVARPGDVEAALEAITTGIKGVTVKNLNSANADKVVKANDALDDLKNTYSKNLTKAQEKILNKNTKNVETLYNYMLYNGIVTVEPNGWVDLGNGDWDYYVDGKAFTGWVCSAKDVWYYVSNGHMLRDAWVWRDSESAYYVGNNGKMVYGPTTVKGYELDANGLWHK